MRILVADILQSSAQTLINTVNCVGIMGKGIALEFKKKFPDMFEDYAKRCQRNEVHLGVPYLYRTLLPPQIINFPTKDHWKSVSKIADIERGLDYLVAHQKEWNITSLAVPPLGCGNGQLEWRQVGPLIYRKLQHLDIPIDLFAPYGTNPKELSISFLEQEAPTKSLRNKTVQSALNPAWVALVEILSRIEQEPYHWPIGRVLFQKIAYVATHQGLPTGFEYQKGSFGPFSKDLKRAEAKLINNNLLQEKRLGKMFMVQVGPHFKRIRSDYVKSLDQWMDVITRTADLFMRMNSSQAEIVATVFFASNLLTKSGSHTPTEREVLDAVMQWKQRRRPPLDSRDVASAIRNLGTLGWLHVTPTSDLPLPEEEAVPA